MFQSSGGPDDYTLFGGRKVPNRLYQGSVMHGSDGRVSSIESTGNDSYMKMLKNRDHFSNKKSVMGT